MSQLMEKVSYLRGLMEGMKLDTTTNEGLLLSKIVDVLEGMACEIADVADAQAELSEYVDSIDQDLAELEELFEDDDDEDDEEEYEDEDDEEEDEDEDDDEIECDGNCAGCSGCGDIEDEDDSDDVFVECTCTECGGTFYVKEEELGGSAFHICPRCGVRIHVVPDYEADIPVAVLADEAQAEE